MEKAIKEVRVKELRALENEEMTVEGYAVVYDNVTDLGWCKEVIDRNAFNDCDIYLFQNRIHPSNASAKYR